MNSQSSAQLDKMINQLFQSLDIKNEGYITVEDLLYPFLVSGVGIKNPKIKNLKRYLQNYPSNKQLTKAEFKSCIEEEIIYIQKILQRNLVIPDFKSFSEEVTEIFKETQKNEEGKVADYIPQLSRVNPHKYAVSLCTIDGQQLHLGDVKENFCAQSSSKPFNYCMALEEFGDIEVHKHVGREPSGRSFNELTLNEKGLPHNPMINSGAIMTCSMIKPNLNIADRFEYVMETWRKLSGNAYIGFNNSVYLSERQTADRNFALGYFMREKKAFPQQTNLLETLEFYFQCCSIEINSMTMARIAATLANGGTSPLTHEEIFSSATVKNCLSLMGSCGMYDFSGEFSFKIGLPAKSGVSGVIILVIPNVMGLCIWSPRVDVLGNSVRGIDFCSKLVEKYNFHNYDSLVSRSAGKKDPRLKKNALEIQSITDMCWAAARGDLESLQTMKAYGKSFKCADYDGRSPIHLAASEGHLEVVKYLYHHGADLSVKDRSGSTPLEDARRGGHKQVEEYIKQEVLISKTFLEEKTKTSNKTLS